MEVIHPTKGRFPTRPVSWNARSAERDNEECWFDGFHAFPELMTSKRERFSWGFVPVSPLAFTGWAAACSLVTAAKAMSRSNPVAFCFSATCPHLRVVAKSQLAGALQAAIIHWNSFGYDMMLYNDASLVSS